MLSRSKILPHDSKFIALSLCSTDATRDVLDEERRSINDTMSKNRGLIPNRAKDKKTPRIKNRKKFDKKVRQRNSIVSI